MLKHKERIQVKNLESEESSNGLSRKKVLSQLSISWTTSLTCIHTHKKHFRYMFIS